MLRPALLSLLSLVALLHASSTPALAGPTLGVNQAWVEGAFGRDLSQDWDPDAWRRLLRLTRASGAKVMRVWLFEGHPFEGVAWDLHRPVAPVPGFVEHVRALAAMGREEGVQLYWTAFDGNWPGYVTDPLAYARAWNVFNDRFGYGREFRERVLAPVLAAIAAEPASCFALDLLNEAQGCLGARGGFVGGWAGARRFLSEWAAFVKQRAPGVRVTASSGHHTGSADLLAGRFEGLGLDFRDVHLYEDGGMPFDAWWLAWQCRQRGIGLVIGEHGQRSSRVDPALQARATDAVLSHAERAGVLAILPWRLEDRRPDGARFTLWENAGQTPRPVVDVMRRWAARW